MGRITVPCGTPDVTAAVDDILPDSLLNALEKSDNCECT